MQPSVIYHVDFSKGNMVLILWSMCAQGECVHVCVCVCDVCGCSVTQLCPTLCDPMDCNPLGSSFHGIFQTRILEQVAICYTRGSSQLWDQTTYLVSPALAGRFFTTMPPGKPRAHAVIAKQKKKPFHCVLEDLYNDPSQILDGSWMTPKIKTQVCWLEKRKEVSSNSISDFHQLISFI